MVLYSHKIKAPLKLKKKTFTFMRKKRMSKKNIFKTNMAYKRESHTNNTRTNLSIVGSITGIGITTLRETQVEEMQRHIIKY